MDATATAGFLRFFRDVPDPRTGNFVTHRLHDLIVIAVLAVICGADGWVQVASWGRCKAKWLATFLNLPGGIPSHDTFDRVFSMLDPASFEQCFLNWMAAVVGLSAGRLVSIDGKAIRRSFEHAWDKSGMTHLLSAFVSQADNRVVFAQLAVEDESNEIVAIPNLLDLLDLRGAVVTIDAIGCQREVAAKVIAGGGDYLLPVKENQPTLLNKTRLLLSDLVLDHAKGIEDKHVGYFERGESGHGRHETRRAWVSDQVHWLGKDLLALWPGLSSIALVERTRQDLGDLTGKVSVERQVYISSLKGIDAQVIAAAARGHWSIENNLHWQLDVSFGEDHNRTRKGNGAENHSRLCRIALNVLKRDASIKAGIKTKRLNAGWDHDYLLRLISHAPTEPLLKDFKNIKEQDAVLAYDRKEIVTDETGKPVTHWDGHTMKVSPVTGEDIPDETVCVPIFRYVNPRKAEWPKADYVVGNPPFLGKGQKIRSALGSGYVDALRAAHLDVPESADFVMYWWNHAANLARGRAIAQFGFITTNSIKMSLNRRIVQAHLQAELPLVIRFAIPDHPWIEASDGAAVDISMTVVSLRDQIGNLGTVATSTRNEYGEVDSHLEINAGRINADLTIGTSPSDSSRLEANRGMACPGVQLSGQGFTVPAERLTEFSAKTRAEIIRPFCIGNDLLKRPRGNFVIDTININLPQLQNTYPDAFQWLHDHVKSDREAGEGGSKDTDEYATQWWKFAKSRSAFRPALSTLGRYIGVCRTAKYRIFVFLPSSMLAETTVCCIALDDAFALGVLSSAQHEHWVLAQKATLEDRPRYNTTLCFDPFPFPVTTDSQKSLIRALGESLDAHRKQRQALHPGLTITDMYNVLEKLRRNEVLTAKDRVIHEQGIVSVLKQIHDDLDAAVADAYGWPADLPDEEILRRLVALNAERAEEEKRGLIRRLRPEFQNPTGAFASQGTLGIAPVAAAKAKGAAKLPWPKSLAEQAQAVRAALAARTKPVAPAELAGHFKSAKSERVAELLATLAALGQARRVAGERYVA